jgi:hypothetical protein
MFDEQEDISGRFVRRRGSFADVAPKVLRVNG